MFAAKMPSSAYGFSQGARRRESLKLFLQTGIMLLQSWPILMIEGPVHRPSILYTGRYVIGQHSSGHQNREARLVQDLPCDPTKQPLVQCGVTIGAHDKEIGAKGACLRQQKVTHLLSSG